MDIDPGMSGEPLLNFGVFVDGVVVPHEAQLDIE